MSYGSRRAAPRSGSRSTSRWPRAIIPVAAAGNEFAERQPARVPGVAAARGHRRGDRRPTTRARRSPTPTTRSTSARRASGSSPRSRRRWTPTAPGRLRGARRDELRRADGLRRRWRGSAPRGRSSRPTSVIQAVRLTRARRRAARLGPADRVRRAQHRRGAGGRRRAAADPGPARAQRQPRLGERARCCRGRRRSGRAGRQARWTRTLDKQEDPVDVYRIVVPARPLGADHRDPALRRPVAGGVLRHARSRSTTSTGRVGRSRRAGSKRTERVTIVNPGAEARSYYVAVTPQGNSRYQEREYSLRVS